MRENDRKYVSSDEFVVLATLDYKSFIVYRAGIDYPSIYKVVAGPASEDDCKDYIESFIENNPFLPVEGGDLK